METIKSNAEISSLFTHGKRLQTPYLTFIVVRNEKQHDPSGRAAFIFLAKSNIVRASYSKVLAACDDTLKRAGVR